MESQAQNMNEMQHAGTAKSATTEWTLLASFIYRKGGTLHPSTNYRRPSAEQARDGYSVSSIDKCISFPGKIVMFPALSSSSVY